MAETATTKAAPATKPERPNEEEYKAKLAKLEKEWKAAQDRQVSWGFFLYGYVHE
jgi:hypothetical protein